jgi:hypothetical protein
MSMDVHWMPTDVHGSMTPLKYPFVHVDPLNHSFPDKTPHVQQINRKFNQTINPTKIIKYTQGYIYIYTYIYISKSTKSSSSQKKSDVQIIYISMYEFMLCYGMV